MAFLKRARGPSMDETERVRRAAEAENSALACMQAGDLDQAKTQFRVAVSLDPDNAALRAQLGLVLFRLGRMEDAGNELQVAIEISPGDDTLRHSYGQVLEGLLLYDDAAAQYLIAADLSPRSARHRAALAALELKRNNLSKAEAYLHTARQLNANEPEVLAVQADFRQRSGDFAGAIEALQRAVSIRTDHPINQFRLGLLLEETGDLDAAIEHLRIAHDGSAGDTRIVFALGRTLMKRGRRSDALNLYVQVMTADSAHLATYAKDRDQLKLQYAEPLPTQGSKLHFEAPPAGVASHGAEAPHTAVEEPLGQHVRAAHAPGLAADPIAQLEAEVAADPANARLHQRLSILYLRAGRLGEAKEHGRIAETLRGERAPNQLPSGLATQ